MFEGINGKNVLITGASSGIGASSAEIFARYGAIVGIHYNTNKNQAENLKNKIESDGGKALIFQANLQDIEQRDCLVQQFIGSVGGIDVLINNASAIYGHGHFLEMTSKSWNDTINICLNAPFFLARDCFQYMMEHGGGRIINISSIASKYGGSEFTTHYGAAKAGIDAITHTMARAGAQYNILVNSVQPGVIDTPVHQKIGRTSLKERVQKIPLQRAGKPLDVAQMCLFLASDCGNYITNQVIGVTGGD